MNFTEPDSMEKILSRILLKGKIVSKKVTAEHYLDIYRKKPFPSYNKVSKNILLEFNKFKKN